MYKVAFSFKLDSTIEKLAVFIVKLRLNFGPLLRSDGRSQGEGDLRLISRLLDTIFMK